MTDTFGNTLGTPTILTAQSRKWGTVIYTEDWSVTNPFGRTPDPYKHGAGAHQNLAPGKYGVRIDPVSGAKTILEML